MLTIISFDLAESIMSWRKNKFEAVALPVAFLLTLFFTRADQCFAQMLNDPTGLAASSDKTIIGSFVGKAVSFFYGLVGIGFFIMLLWGGFTWMTSAGNPEKVKKATSILTAAVIGIVIILAAGVVNVVLKGILGLD